MQFKDYAKASVSLGALAIGSFEAQAQQEVAVQRNALPTQQTIAHARAALQQRNVDARPLSASGLVNKKTPFGRLIAHVPLGNGKVASLHATKGWRIWKEAA